ncbi:MmgE/PrpD family protein [Telmatospirillum siberiense]|uniref:MmgE/PrpD family protein n=2 Tax=Telmatospirillum siberiense TaxID=382514 RepID=A0A2N3PT71_9PROT|nr:MmgE/PrpD family protein [Telmatospirillum siberiense]
MAAASLYGYVRPSHAAADNAVPSSSPDLQGPVLAERLAFYADTLDYADLGAETVEIVKSHLIDSLGCAIAAFDEPPVRICRDVVGNGTAGAATIIGTPYRTTPDLATFVNGAALRYLDLNDVYVGRQAGEAGHPSDNITACLAVAEAEKANGRELITAIVLSYEIVCRLLDAVDLIGRGWDHPLCSLPATALAAGKLMRIGPDKLAQAVNISLNGHVPLLQTRMQILSDWKGLADAEAARCGVFAAQLARGGLTGPAPIFEGKAGIFKQVTGPLDIEVEAFGRPFRIADCGMKVYPAQIYSATVIPAAIAVAKEAGNLERIKSIEIATTLNGYRNAGRDPEKWAPETKATADHSLPYIAARAMFDGDLTNDSYASEKLRDPRLRVFMQKITVKEDPALTALMPKAVPNRVTAVLDDGQTIIHQVDDLPGFVGRPMQRADAERKFRGNVGHYWPERQTRAVLDALWDLERQDDLGRLLKKFVIKR